MSLATSRKIDVLKQHRGENPESHVWALQKESWAEYYAEFRSFATENKQTQKKNVSFDFLTFFSPLALEVDI